MSVGVASLNRFLEQPKIKSIQGLTLNLGYTKQAPSQGLEAIINAYFETKILLVILLVIPLVVLLEILELILKFLPVRWH